MKNLACLVLALLPVSPAVAQGWLQAEAGPGVANLQMDLRYRVSGGCRTAGSAPMALDPASRDWQPLALPVIRCNFSGSTSARFWSSNAGLLTPAGIAIATPAGIPYELRVGDTILGRPGTAASPLVAPVGPAPADIPRNLQVFIRFTGPPAEAGDFSDTIYMEVAP